MPPKRKGSKSSKAPAAKRPKSKSPSPEEEENLVEVDWVVPEVKRKEDIERKYIDDYAQALYDREARDLNPVQPALPDAPIRAPIYKKAGAKGLVSGDPNKSSRSLRNFFNEIERLNANEPDGLHDHGALGEKFRARGENATLVLSRTEDSEIFFWKVIVGYERKRNPAGHTKPILT